MTAIAAHNEMMGTQLAASDSGDFANFLDNNRFQQLWKVANLFSRSKLIPQHFQGQTEDCFIASQMAMRLGIDPFMFMQNTYVTNGKPGMEGKMAIALVNSSGMFKGQLRYRLSGEGDDYGCVAYTHDKQTGEELTGPRVTIAIAKSEGWYQRNPKWRNVPDLMLQYRAGAWFGRLYCPERLMGMQTVDELQETDGVRHVVSREVDGQVTEADAKIAELKAKNGSRVKPPSLPQSGPAQAPAVPAVSSPQPAAETTEPETPLAAPASAGTASLEAEDLELQLFNMLPEDFERNLYGKARESYKVMTRNLFRDGTFIYAKAHGAGVGNIVKMEAKHRLELWKAVAAGLFDFKTGTIIDAATGQVAD